MPLKMFCKFFNNYYLKNNTIKNVQITKKNFKDGLERCSKLKNDESEKMRWNND